MEHPVYIFQYNINANKIINNVQYYVQLYNIK